MAIFTALVLFVPLVTIYSLAIGIYKFVKWVIGALEWKQIRKAYYPKHRWCGTW